MRNEGSDVEKVSKKYPGENGVPVVSTEYPTVSTEYLMVSTEYLMVSTECQR
jgi:hypothetical protein